MTALAIWKYQIPLDDEFELQLPPGAEVIHVGEQGGGVFIWIKLELNVRPSEIRKFYVRGTGHPLPADYKHLGTVQLTWPQLVFHVGEPA